MDRLIDEPWSRWRAKQLGGSKWREHLGWSAATYVSAAQFDALQALLASTEAARLQKKPRKVEPLPRPSFAKDSPDWTLTEQDPTVDDLMAMVREFDMDD